MLEGNGWLGLSSSWSVTGFVFGSSLVIPGKFVTHGLKFARLRSKVKPCQCDAMVLLDPPRVAWHTVTYVLNQTTLILSTPSFRQGL